MIVSPDKNGRIDPVVYSLLKDVNSPIPLVPITRMDDFEFNSDLNKLERYILIDFCEYGWDENYISRTHLFGVNTIKYADKFKGEEWKIFDEWIASNPPALYFKRELLNGDESEIVRPINYPCWHTIPEPNSKQSFDSRTFQTNFIWGFSHEYRKQLHGDIWKRSGEFGYMVCDSLYIEHLFVQHEPNPNKWLTSYVPWYQRFGMDIIMDINERSKISVSIAGAGKHCFRHSESPINSVMYLWDDNIKYSYEWINNVNCIRTKQGTEIESIIQALDNTDLYSIYLAGVENCRKYYLPDYINNYILKTINEVCN